jgi:hypothetical protein
MIERVSGCHHCIGTTFAVTNLIFNFLEGRAISTGSLIADDLAALRLRFLESFSSGYDFFEKIHTECMEASRRTKSAPFSRDRLLPSLLSACGKRTARRTFTMQLEQCGNGWLDDFFCAFAEYIYSHVRSNVEPQLIAVFVEAAGKYKSNLTVSSLLSEDKTQKVLFDCVAPFVDAEGREKFAHPISTAVNQQIAKIRKITGSDAAKTTSEEIIRFLELFPSEMAVTIRASG